MAVRVSVCAVMSMLRVHCLDVVDYINTSTFSLQLFMMAVQELSIVIFGGLAPSLAQRPSMIAQLELLVWQQENVRTLRDGKHRTCLIVHPRPSSLS